MTRKDYVNIAAAVRATQERITEAFKPAPSQVDPQGDEEARDNQLRGVRRTAAHICDALAADNPRFDPAIFLQRCGYGATTMNPRDPSLDLRPLPGEDETDAQGDRRRARS